MTHLGTLNDKLKRPSRLITVLYRNDYNILKSLIRNIVTLSLYMTRSKKTKQKLNISTLAKQKSTKENK